MTSSEKVLSENEVNTIFRKRKQKQILRWVIALAVAVPLFFLCLFAYASVTIAQAKDGGIYPSAKEAARVVFDHNIGEAKVKSVDSLHCEQNDPHGMPHVWFCTAWVTYDRNLEGHDTPKTLPGGFFVKVREGWVWMSEGSLPGLVGRVMEMYHLEGTP